MILAILAQSYLFDETASINGTLVQLYNLSKGFEKAGIEVHYVCTTKDASKPKHQKLEGIHFHWIQLQVGFFEWKRVMPLYTICLNEIKPDAVYVRGRNVMQYVAGKYASENNKIFVWGTNGDDSAEFWKNVKRLKNSNKSILRKIFLYFLKAYEDVYINRGMKMTNFIVNQSLQQQKATKENLNKKGIILPSYFLPVKNKTSKDNIILWLATLSLNKQPHLFIELFHDLEVHNWKGVLGGGTSNINYQLEIKNTIQSLPIKMIGEIPFQESFNYYQAARIYVNTSKPKADGLPNAYIQSWLSGAVVLSLHHDPNYWMEKYQIGFCANGDLNKLRDKLQELINDDEQCKMMSNNAKIFAEQQFSNSSIINKYIALFEGKE